MGTPPKFFAPVGTCRPGAAGAQRRRLRQKTHWFLEDPKFGATTADPALGFNGNLMGFNGIYMGFYEDLMGFDGI